METSTKMSKHFLKLADLIKADKNERQEHLKMINVKDNIVYSSNGRILLRCILNTDNMPEYNLETGYYDITGNYMVKDNDFSNDWNYPAVDKIMDCTFEKTFDLAPDYVYNSFVFTLSANGILFDYAGFDKQLKQLFSKGSEFRVYFNATDKMFMLRCLYPVCYLPTKDTEIQLFLMPMKHDHLTEVMDITYNPVSKVYEKEVV